MCRRSQRHRSDPVGLQAAISVFSAFHCLICPSRSLIGQIVRQRSFFINSALVLPILLYRVLHMFLWPHRGGLDSLSDRFLVGSSADLRVIFDTDWHFSNFQGYEYELNTPYCRGIEEFFGGLESLSNGSRSLCYDKQPSPGLHPTPNPNAGHPRCISVPANSSMHRSMLCMGQ